ncbi:MAG: folate/biopterin family MFS transporter [Okeania sp. SIO3B5]|uniref:folate/biopterin family MFS transporter n=1 Tax=Okeania sp. SIO3B5 TaxID=2607811 RepID=UPI0013FFDF95|nr:folate/biopterin family MFS transporter [Okeania sp. SIO3B5]NEO57475.1 folate/biopterin family MFS transporter [Okeania sp. SIO3B5]
MFISSQGIIKLKKSLKQRVFFGNEPTPELIAILLVYFVQGILGLGRLAVSFFLKDELAMSPAEVSAMFGVVVIPWMIKPVFGFISDGVPILGYRRRPYMIFSGILGAFSWIALAKWVDTPLAATGAIALSSLSVAISDVIVDSLVVQRVQKESISSTGSLQSLCWVAAALGGLMTAYLSGYLLEHFSNQTVFLITAIFPLIVSVVAWLINEEKVTIGINFDNVKQQIKQVKIAVTKKSILLPTAFIFLWQATPNSESAFFFFSTNELGFQPEFLGRIQLVTSIAALIGVWLFQRFFKSVPFRQIFGWSTVISAVLGMTTLLLVTHSNRSLGIDDHWFSLGDSLVLTVMGKIAFMPVLVLAARLCPPGVEATLFALLMSIYNLAQLTSHEGGALLMHWLEVTETNFDNLWLLIVITNLSTLLPLFLLNWLPAANAQMEDKEEENMLTLTPNTQKLIGDKIENEEEFKNLELRI